MSPQRTQTARVVAAWAVCLIPAVVALVVLALGALR